MLNRPAMVIGTGPAGAAEPGAPAGHPPAALRHLGNPWGVVTRTLTLAGLIATGLLLWGQFTFESKWVTRFVVHNAYSHRMQVGRS